MAKTLPTPERLREVLNYDPDTGVLTWRVTFRNGVKAGAVAGWMDGPYFRITLDGVIMQAHRVIVALVTGAWPLAHIDHCDRDGHNNRWLNLRPASPSQNNFNKRVYKNSVIGIKGVRILSSGRYQARILDKAIGTFGSAVEAGAAYIEASRELYGEFSYA